LLARVGRAPCVRAWLQRCRPGTVAGGRAGRRRQHAARVCTIARSPAINTRVPARHHRDDPNHVARAGQPAPLLPHRPGARVAVCMCACAHVCVCLWQGGGGVSHGERAACVPAPLCRGHVRRDTLSQAPGASHPATPSHALTGQGLHRDVPGPGSAAVLHHRCEAVWQLTLRVARGTTSCPRPPRCAVCVPVCLSCLCVWTGLVARDSTPLLRCRCNARL
jgi:hypothetical protein